MKDIYQYVRAIADAFLLVSPVYLAVPLIGYAVRRRVGTAARIAAKAPPARRRERYYVECARIALHGGRLWAVIVVMYGLALAAIFEPGIYAWLFFHALAAAIKEHR
ncbi:MAG TPA: hypothetical protein VFA95_11620 [Gammaproteobacteria bacterium]|nr:hypothetical protein [Gammaproteobacteria bacterium]